MGIDLLNLGQPYGAKPYFEKASIEVTRSIALASENPDKERANELVTYYRILAKNNLLVIKRYGEMDRVEDTIRAIAEARRLDQSGKSAWDLLEGDVYKAAARSSDAAGAYRNALSTDPDSLDALYNLSLLLVVSGEKEGLVEAIKYMSRFVEKAPPSDARSAEVRASLESLRKQLLDDSAKRDKLPISSKRSVRDQPDLKPS
jgi:tetratricopeptide (TPR) repeat protein